MGTDDTSFEGADAPLAAPPVAPGAPIETPPPIETPAPPAAPERRSRLWRWLGVLVCIAAVAAAVVAVIAYGRATDDRRAAEREVVRAERDLADATERAEAAEADATTERARADEAEANADQLSIDLTDRDAELERYRAGVSEFVALSFEFGVGVSSSDAACLGDAFVADQGPGALDFLSSGFGTGPGADEFVADLVSYAESCGIDPSSFDPGQAGDAGQPLEPGVAYGDNPTLDALYDACTEGDGAACDELFLSSAPESEYEEYGLTCGDRFAPADAPEVCAGAI